MMHRDLREAFLARVRQVKELAKVPGTAAPVYRANAEIWVWVLCSRGNYQGRYWFGIEVSKVLEWAQRARLLLCFVCGREDRAVLVPDAQFVSWFGGAEPNKKGQWMVIIEPREGRLILRLRGGDEVDLSPYVNRFELLTRGWWPVGTPPGQSAPAEPLAPDQAILSLPGLVSHTLHDRVVEMLKAIGEWMGYVAEAPYKPASESPYQLDVAWLERGAMEVAVEVHIGGNATEAKDRLAYARRLGARKLVAVSAAPDARLRDVCEADPETRSWVQIWGAGQVYRMYVSGRPFFELYERFVRPEQSAHVVEVFGDTHA